jgi:hypothetical protein
MKPNDHSILGELFAPGNPLTKGCLTNRSQHGCDAQFGAMLCHLVYVCGQ